MEQQTLNDVVAEFQSLLNEHYIHCNPSQLHQFTSYYRLLVEWNEKMNLTALTGLREVFIKHFYDSLTVAIYKDFNGIQTVADIGAGAGFPSIPLKIIFPHLKVTIIDSLKKRILFLTTLVNELQLTDVQCIHGRAEDVAHLTEHREQYDVVTARAVAKLPVLNELCIPFANKSGLFIAMKGADYEHEIDEATVSLKKLNASIAKVYAFQLPYESALRAQIHITKLATTSKQYPRKAGVPSKTPLL